jgi:hypothetical protein
VTVFYLHVSGQVIPAVIRQTCFSEERGSNPGHITNYPYIVHGFPEVFAHGRVMDHYCLLPNTSLFTVCNYLSIAFGAA